MQVWRWRRREGRPGFSATATRRPSRPTARASRSRRIGRSFLRRSTARKGRQPRSRCEGPADRRPGRRMAGRSPSSRTAAIHSFIALWTLGSDAIPLHQPADQARQRAGLVDGRQDARLRASARHRWRAAKSARGARVVVVDPRSPTYPGQTARPTCRPLGSSKWQTAAIPIDPITRDPVGLNVQWAADDTLIYFSLSRRLAASLRDSHSGKDSKPLLLTTGRVHGRAGDLHAGPADDHLQRERQQGSGKDGGKDGEKTPGDAADIDRRHLFKVPINAATPTALTSGRGIEWNPVVTGDGQSVRVHQRRAQRPPIPAVVPAGGGAPRLTRRRPHPGRLPPR